MGKNYKPFDLEKAKAGAKVMTRGGKPVRIIATDLKGDYPIVAIHTEYDENGEAEYPYNYTIDGRFHTGVHDDLYDLVMCPEKHEGWTSLYRNGNSVWAGDVFASQELAVEEGKEDCAYFCTIKINWEE